MKIIYDDKKIKHFIEKYNLENIVGNRLLIYSQLFYYEKGEKILHAGDTLNYLYFFVYGKIKISSIEENGKSILLRFYDNFNSLGEVELIQNVPISSNVESVENTYLIALPINKIRRELNKNNNLLLFIAHTLSSKLNSISNNSSYNLLYPLINRLASYLYEHTDKNDTIILNSTFLNISEFLGTTYRHLHRTLKELESKGIIKHESKQITIINKDKLKELSKNIYR